MTRFLTTTLTLAFCAAVALLWLGLLVAMARTVA